MLTSTDKILEMLPNRMSGTPEQIFTPPNIADDMIDLLPDNIWNSHTTFFDPMCKSGIFLNKIYHKLMDSDNMKQEFPDKDKRRDHILENQLFGISPTDACFLMSTRSVYGRMKLDGHIIQLNGLLQTFKNRNIKIIENILQERLGKMKFDIVVGNPPYNKDAYLDFVTMGHHLADKYSLWITPAKWQAKGGQE
jgi:site-specific DNA-methyltransferase (adenine-specific)